MSDVLPALDDGAEIGAAYLAAEGLEAVLAEELERRGCRVLGWHGPLALTADAPMPSSWALECWTAPEIATFESIGDAATLLRGRQRNWSHLPLLHHRRSALIADRLPPVKAAALAFPALPPAAPLGAWTLLDPKRMLFSTSKTSPFPNGRCQFVENRTDPPSRAYLKLWEACTRLGRWPEPGERCFDLGASPGGWTWAVASLGAEITAIDKAALDPAVAAMPNVQVRNESAFALDPRDQEPVDWLFSDIIAYPSRLSALVRRWIDAGAAKHIVCTVKFQGQTDHEAADAFAAIPNSALRHLWHNKHELTFFWSAEEAVVVR